MKWVFELNNKSKQTICKGGGGGEGGGCLGESASFTLQMKCK